jgi:hypothetical protein
MKLQSDIPGRGKFCSGLGDGDGDDVEDDDDEDSKQSFLRGGVSGLEDALDEDPSSCGSDVFDGPTVLPIQYTPSEPGRVVIQLGHFRLMEMMCFWMEMRLEIEDCSKE